MNDKRDSFGSQFGILVALAGSAVGLGNLWRFPYLVGTNGGAAFIIIYLLFVFLLCLPIMYSEFVIGRRSQSNVFGSFRVLAPGSKWSVVGIVCVLCAISILAFYSVVGGWSVNYLVKALTFNITSIPQGELAGTFDQVVSGTYRPLMYVGIFIAITALIVIAGIKKGIEKYSKIMMPLLFLMIILIAIKSLTLPGASEGVSFLFKPDFSKVTAQTLLDALGQAFFSLSIGCGTIITYGSYVSKKENIIKISTLASVSDTLFAIIAGLAIMPAVFAFGISPSEGPGLVFVTLPHIFAQITGGSIIAIAFFFILFIAAITSSISILEVIVSYLLEEFKIKRIYAVLLSLTVVVTLATLCSLSQGVLSDAKVFGYNFFDLFDNLSANILMPIGGLLAVLFVGWRMKKEDFLDEVTNSGKLKIKRLFLQVVYYTVKFVAPIVIIIIMISGMI